MEVWVFPWPALQPAHSLLPHSLWAPKAPDATADMGRREFTYVMPPQGEGCLAPFLLFSKPRFFKPSVGEQQLRAPNPFCTTGSFPALAQAPIQAACSLNFLLLTLPSGPGWGAHSRLGCLPPGGAGDHPEGKGWERVGRGPPLALPTAHFPPQAEVSPQGRTLVLGLCEGQPCGLLAANVTASSGERSPALRVLLAPRALQL